MKNVLPDVPVVNTGTLPVTKTLPAIKAVAKDKRLTQKAKLVFLGIYGFTGSDNSKAWPSKKALADTLGMHHQTVTAAIQELVQLEYLATSSFGGRVVFHLRPTVEVTANVVQVPWNAKSDNPKEKNQRTLGNGDARVVNSDARVVTTDDKGRVQRETNKEKRDAVRIELTTDGLQNRSLTAAGFEQATNDDHSDGLANRSGLSPSQKMDQLLDGTRSTNGKMMILVDARRKAKWLKDTFKYEDSWEAGEKGQAAKQEFRMLNSWIKAKEIEIRGFSSAPC